MVKIQIHPQYFKWRQSYKYFMLMLLLPINTARKSFFVAWLSIFVFGNVYAQPGILDDSFGNLGVVVSDPFLRDETLTTMAIQSDQKILAAGYSHPEPFFDFVVVRYLPDGSLDPEFGNAGKVRLSINGRNDRCNAIAIQSDGRILLAGLTTYQSKVTFDLVQDFAIVRLNQEGSIDSTFGDMGIIVTDLGGEEDIANEVLVQVDGKIIAAGRYSNIDTADFAMVRYEPNGNIDSTFGMNGFVKTSIQDWNDPKAGMIQPDGMILLSGYAGTDSTADFAIVRYQKDGSLDSIFGNNGIVQTDFPGINRTDYALSLLLDPDDKLVVGGYSNINFDILVSEIAIARYNPDGSLDNSFGENGIFLLPLGTESEVFSMVRQDDGKYWLAGRSNYIGNTPQWILARIDKDGAGLDTMFGGGGVCTTPGGEQNIAFQVLKQNDNKIVIGGTHPGINSLDFTLARFVPQFKSSTDSQIPKPLSISISPNPCSDNISIDVGNQIGSFNCEISNLAGNILWRSEREVSSPGKLWLDTRFLMPGIYMLSIWNKNVCGLRRFVVTK